MQATDHFGDDRVFEVELMRRWRQVVVCLCPQRPKIYWSIMQHLNVILPCRSGIIFLRCSERMHIF